MNKYLFWLVLLVPFALFAEEELPDLNQIKIYEGKIVRNIIINVKEIYESDKWLLEKLNNLKIKTKEAVIKRELVFKEGDRLTTFSVSESGRNLRNLKFVRDVQIDPVLLANDQVDVFVTVNDTWTLVPLVSASSGDGRNKRSIGLSERNLFGYGKRLEFNLEEDGGRKSFESIYEDQRLFNTPNKLLLGYFDRNDGDVALFKFFRPFRTFLDEYAYGVSFDYGDTVERLFRNTEERFLFRKDSLNVDAHYTIARGDPEVNTYRYAFGYSYIDESFSDATLEDFEDLNVDPDSEFLEDVPLANNRRFSGPYLAFESIQPKFVPKQYIDRFERIEDYNMGRQFSFKSHYSPTYFGSKYDAFLLSSNLSQGYSFNEKAFVRGEFSWGTRMQGDDFENTIIHSEIRAYNDLGIRKLFGYSTGRHTLAGGLTFDYTNELDADIEYLLGADNFLRGYPARTFSGNQRFALNLEDRTHLMDNFLDFFSIGAVLFMDVGSASDQAFKSLLKEELYADFGVGLRLAIPSSSRSRVFRFDLAFPVRDGPEGSDTEAMSPRLLFSVEQVFDSFLSSENRRSKSVSVDTGF